VESYDNYKSSYDRDGFVVVRQLLDPAELAELTAALDRYIRDVVPTLPRSHAFYEDRARPETLKQLQHLGGDPFFAAYRRQPRWLALARALVGEPVEARDGEWFNKPPRLSRETPPHQDNYYFNLVPPKVVTIWMALDSVDRHNGCLRYVAGSHRQGLRPHGLSPVLGFSQAVTDYGPDDAAREVEVHLAPGDVVAHHGMTIHRADANGSSNRQRRAFAMVFRGESCRLDENRFAQYQQQLRQQHAALGWAEPRPADELP
jgi:phytanoyl-CoA hydroxylase